MDDMEVNSLLLLTPSDCLDSSKASALLGNRAVIDKFKYVGGEAAVSKTVRDAIDEIMP